ncbi:UNVERIFIED_CONTAM: hypothetical protein FKN15_067506 [Acipenser sinensis]|uniref:Ribonuclease P/MRP protein subunit POP5 n=1 Tax=Huso huso TaxID=61971 RepID=A0ABR0YW04_HUSHU
MVRFKSRYLLCEVSFADPRSRQCLEERAIFSAVRDAIARAHGDYGAACCAVSFAVKYLNAYTGILLLRCRKEHYRLLWSALPFIIHLESRGQRQPCRISSIHVGGTIRTCQRFLIRYNRQQLLRMLPGCQSEEERASVHRAVLSCSLKQLEEEGGSRDEDSD